MRKPPHYPHDLGRHDLADLLGTIDEEVRQCFGEGKVADYIPSLADVPRDRFGNLDNDVQDVLDFYYLQCSLRMDCVDLARSVRYLADAGHCASSDAQVTTAEGATRINSLMMTAGTYDAAGDFAFYVGLPAKSGWVAASSRWCRT